MAEKGEGGRRAIRQRTIQIQAGALDDLRHWVREDERIASKVLELIEAARRDSFTGIGKPEPLRNLGSDVWSRRISREDRLVYRVADDHIDVLQARYPY